MQSTHEFSAYLKKKREQANLSQGLLASLAGVSQAYVSQMESGDRGVPSPQILKKIAKPLGVQYGELLQRAGYSNEDTLKNSQPSFAVGVICDTIINIVYKIEKNERIESFVEILNIVKNGGNFSLTQLQKMLWKTNHEKKEERIPQFSEIKIAEQIDDLLQVLDELLTESYYSSKKEIRDFAMLDLVDFIDHQEGLRYKGRLLKNDDRSRILIVLQQLFPETKRTILTQRNIKRAPADDEQIKKLSRRLTKYHEDKK